MAASNFLERFFSTSEITMMHSLFSEDDFSRFTYRDFYDISELFRSSPTERRNSRRLSRYANSESRRLSRNATSESRRLSRNATSESRRPRNARSRSSHRSGDQTSRVPGNRDSRNETDVPGNGLQGRFPVFKFSGPAGSECLVCYGEFEYGQNVEALSCLHKFHVSCINPWLKTEETCPVCRYDLTKIVDIHKL